MSEYNTGNKIGSTDPRDLYDNAQNLDNAVNDQTKETWIDRLKKTRKSWYGMERDFSRLIVELNEEMDQAIINAGYQLIDSFQDGATLTELNQALRWKKPDGDGEYYRWDGEFPAGGKVVPPGSTPESTGQVKKGAWIGVGQATLSYLIPNVRSLWKEHLEKLGLILVSGSFREGATVTAPNQAVWDDYSGVAYARVSGDSVTVAAGSSPDANWTSAIGARIETWLPNTNPTTDVSVRLQALLTAGGGEIKIPDGSYNVFTGLVTDFSNSSFPSLGAGSQRYDFLGSSKNNTIFINTGSSFLTHTGGVNGELVQGAVTHMEHGNFQLIGGGPASSNGLKYNFSTHINVKNVRFTQQNVAVYFSNCIYNSVEHCTFDSNKYGIKYDSTDITFTTNSSYVDNCIIGSSSQWAIDAQIGLTYNITNSNIEKNGTHEVDYSGGVHIVVISPVCVINITGTYFEANKGMADIYIENQGGGTVVVNITACTFNRGNSDGGYTKTNFKAITKAGRGRVILNLNGCTFFSNETWGFEPSADKPFITPDPFLYVNGLDTCAFNETTSLLGSPFSGSMVETIKVQADGQKLSGAETITVTKSGTGLYTISSATPFGLSTFGNDYGTVAMSTQDGFIASSSAAQNSNTFNVRTKTIAGVAADSGFTVIISRRMS